MEVYRAFAENELNRYIFLFSYSPTEGEVLHRLKELVGYTPYIYDIFPEPNSFSEVAEEAVSIITRVGKEMFLQHGMNITYFDTFRILYGEKISD